MRISAARVDRRSTKTVFATGGAEFEIVWNDSDMNKRNANNQTKSGLYPIFIDAALCLEGFFDNYGFSIVEDPKKDIYNDLNEKVGPNTNRKDGAVTFLKNELESLEGDSEKQNEFRRQFPRTIRDAFRDSSNDCDFNLTHIIEQIENNEFELEDKWSIDGSFLNNKEVERGNFHWKDGIPDTEVIWKPDPEKGRFYIASKYHPSAEYRNKKDKVLRNGILAWAPKNEHIGCGGVDPYNRSKTVDGRGSKGSIHISTKYNTGPFPNNAYLLEYIDRPLKVEHFYEDVIMSHVYFSMPFLAELSSEKFSQYIVDRGYRHFSKNNPFKNFNELSHTEKEFGGVPAQDSKVGDQQFYAIEAYIEDHVGVSRSDSNRPLGEMGFMPFTRTLQQWKDVDTTKRTKYDAYISSSLSLLGNQSRIKKVQPEKPKPIKIRSLYNTYNNNGSVSILN